MNILRLSRLWVPGCLICLMFAAGCEQEQIHTYSAPKMRIPERHTNPADFPALPEAVPTQMLGAILPQGGQTWFFKLTAPPEQAVASREAFAKFVASTRFKDGTPSWEVPADWVEEPGRQMRFTTFHIGAAGPEVSISNFPTPQDRDKIDYELENVNRWRKQMGLPMIQKQEFIDRKFPEDDCEIVTITTGAGNAILLDLIGEMAPSGGGPPFAGPMMGGSAPRPGPVADGGGSDKPKFTAPENWKPGALNEIRVVAFEVTQGDETAEITVSSVGGNPLDNINRWRGQVDLAPWTVDDLRNELQYLTVDGAAAGYVKLVGPANTILGVIHRTDQQTWFIKLTGPNQIATQEQTHFEDFVKSLKF